MTERTLRDDQLPKGAGDAAEVAPVPAASVILLRREPFEVLMMRRNERSSFVPGAWVFPGGTMETSDAIDGDAQEATMKRCAVRELFEETGIWLGSPLEDRKQARTLLLGGESGEFLAGRLGTALDDLVLTARWVTPVGVPKRFDTWFFLASVADGTEGTPDDSEGLELIWVTPDDALQRHQDGSFPMVFPTIRTLEDLSTFASRQALLDARRRAEISITRPVLVVEGGRKKIVIPEEE